MNESEEIALSYLRHYGFKDIRYEPDGNVPPDFLADEKIAVEVRRLNQRDERNKGLEEVAIPLWHGLEGLLPTLGEPLAGESWFVYFNFRRPVPKWRKLEPRVRDALHKFRNRQVRKRCAISITENYEIDVFRTGDPHRSFFVLAGCSDEDSGGWLLCELERNLQKCVAEKARKVAEYRQKYETWWLVLIDHIGYGLNKFEQQLFERSGEIQHCWDRVVLVDPRDHRRAYEI